MKSSYLASHIIAPRIMLDKAKSSNCVPYLNSNNLTKKQFNSHVAEEDGRGSCIDSKD